MPSRVVLDADGFSAFLLHRHPICQAFLGEQLFMCGRRLAGRTFPRASRICTVDLRMDINALIGCWAKAAVPQW